MIALKKIKNTIKILGIYVEYVENQYSIDELFSFLFRYGI
jgi:hypothetical protein